MRVIVIIFVAAVTIGACGTRSRTRIDAPQIVSKLGVSELAPTEALRGTAAAYSQFIDVRTPEEYATGHAERTRNIPLDELAANLDMLEKDEPVYLICGSGQSSLRAAHILDEHGFKQAISITGGIEAWRAAGLPMAKQQ